MTGDLRTLAAALDGLVGVFADRDGMSFGQEMAAEQAREDLHYSKAFIESMVPVYDVWLAARPPCPTCKGKRLIDGSTPYVEMSGASPMRPCSDCPDGVQPFDKWVVHRLLATWAAVHGGAPYDRPMLGRQLLDELRAIGSTR